jgi:hypothetical protein
MEDTKKSSVDVSRRAFLQSSAAAAIGMVVFGSLTESEAHMAASRALSQDPGLEHWLLQTGREKLDSALYGTVEQHLASSRLRT